MKKFNLNVNYVIADFVSRLTVGSLRKLRFIRIVKTKIGMRLLRILYKHGVIRTFKIKHDHLVVYFKYCSGQPVGKLKIVSRPGKRCFWTLGKLSQHYNCHNFSGFYIISTQKGLFTSDYCLLYSRTGGEVLIKVDI